MGERKDIVQLSPENVPAGLTGENWGVIAADPQLREHRALAAAIAQRLDEEAQAFLERS